MKNKLKIQCITTCEAASSIAVRKRISGSARRIDYNRGQGAQDSLSHDDEAKLQAALSAAKSG